MTSLWGDEKLFFSHRRLEDDFMRRPEHENVHTPTFDEATFDPWDLEFNNQVPFVSDNTIFDGIENGCPFQFLIDTFNF